jgi:hypothetical protein
MNLFVFPTIIKKLHTSSLAQGLGILVVHGVGMWPTFVHFHFETEAMPFLIPTFILHRASARSRRSRRFR